MFLGDFGEIDVFLHVLVVLVRRPKLQLQHTNTEKDRTMSNLSILKLTDARKPTQVAAVVQRRNKLIRRIWQQTELARAQQT